MAENKKEHDLELTLGLPPNNASFLSKRHQQAFRRKEAMFKRDLKRKTSVFPQEVCFKRPHEGYNGHFTSSPTSSDNNNNNYCCNSTPGGSSSDTSSQSSHLLETVPTATSTLKQPTSLIQQSTHPNYILSHSQSYSSSSSQRNYFQNLRSPSKSPECMTPTNNTNITRHPIRTHSKKAKVVPEKSSIGHPIPQIPCFTGKSSIEIQSKEAIAVTVEKPFNCNGRESAPLSKMPCVTTTGNGPKGKTITGFLYKYTKTEVSIVCVCHGTSFSPAGFVEHAGGVDVEHPLKEIKVAPFPLS